MTSETAVKSTTVPTSSVWLLSAKVALVLLAMVELGAFMYGRFFRLLALNAMESLVASAGIVDAIAFENRLLGLFIAPMAYGLLAAVSPLIGWWIYSRVEKAQQTPVGWASASLFGATYVFIGLFSAGAMARLGISIDAISTILGLAIIILYVMLFMTAGFVTAAITRIKL